MTTSKFNISGILNKFGSFQTKEWLMGEAAILQENINRRRKENSEDEDPDWYKCASNLIKTAVGYAQSERGEQAWLTYKAARREAIRGYSKEEILITASEMRIEAQKIRTDWRQKSILEILKGNNDSTPLNHERLIHAYRIRDEYYDALWRKIDRRREAIKISLFTLIFFIVAILLYWEFILNLDNSTSIIFMAIWGALGASLTATFSLINSELPDKFTEGAMSRVVTACRPFIGAASAIVVLAFINAKLINTGAEPMAPYAIGFLSGFSEKFFFSVVSKERKKA